jgi:hypothetical protein
MWLGLDWIRLDLEVNVELIGSSPIVLKVTFKVLQGNVWIQESLSLEGRGFRERVNQNMIDKVANKAIGENICFNTLLSVPSHQGRGSGRCLP